MVIFHSHVSIPEGSCIFVVVPVLEENLQSHFDTFISQPWADLKKGSLLGPT